MCLSAGDPGLIPGSGRSPGGGHGNPPQYFCLGNPMERGAWRVTVHGVGKSWTWLGHKHSHMAAPSCQGVWEGNILLSRWPSSPVRIWWEEEGEEIRPWAATMQGLPQPPRVPGNTTRESDRLRPEEGLYWLDLHRRQLDCGAPGGPSAPFLTHEPDRVRIF